MSCARIWAREWNVDDARWGIVVRSLRGGEHAVAMGPPGSGGVTYSLQWITAALDPKDDDDLASPQFNGRRRCKGLAEGGGTLHAEGSRIGADSRA